MAIDRKIQNFTSQEIIDELEDVLHRKFSQSHDIIKREIELLKGYSDIVEPKQKFAAVKDDPKDDIFIEAVVAGSADFIVSQDKEVLKLKEFRGIKIVTPEEFNKICS